MFVLHIKCAHQCWQQPCNRFPFRAPEGLAASASVGHLDPDVSVISGWKPCAL